MGLLKMLGLKEDHAESEQEHEHAHCAHAVLVPRWDRVEDMGNEALAVGYKCYGCGEPLSLEEGRARHASVL